jgi:membrane fusion protein (multidrug efflux system)
MLLKMIQLSLSLFLCFIIISCKKQVKTKRSIPEVVVVQVKSQIVNKIWNLVGQTISEPKVEFTARVKGFLIKRDFKQGTFVKKGTLLFQIEKSLYQAVYKKNKAEVSIKTALLKNATINYERTITLYNRQAISKAALDKAVAGRDSAIGELNVAKAELQQSQLDLDYTDIRAPFDGRIGLSKFNVGNMVGPESGILATIVALDPIFVEFNVNESVFLRAQQASLEQKIPLSKLLKKLELTLILSDGTTVYSQMGKIVFWNNQIDASTGTILLRAKFKNSDHILTPGQYVTVRIKSAQPQKRLVIPQVALQSALGGLFVMVVDSQNIIHKKEVVIGYKFDDMVEIKKGLKEGERVVTLGIQKVREKSKVEISVEKQVGVKPKTVSSKRK